MNQVVRRSVFRWSAFGLFGALLLIAVPSRGRSDDAKKPAPAADAPDRKVEAVNVVGGKGALKEYTGFTRPGAPPDKVTGEGKIEPIQFGVDEEKSAALGCTVYFMVLQNQYDNAEKGDTYGTGVKGFDDLFIAGFMDEGFDG